MEENKTNELLLLAEQVINQSHYAKLSELDICPLDAESEAIRPEDVLCLLKVSEIVYAENETGMDKFSIVFNALHACGASCIMVLQCIQGRTELYLGAINKQKCGNYHYLNVIRDILKTSIDGNLPGAEISEITSRKEMKRILANCLDSGFDSQCITSVSCVANAVDKGQSPSYGIETLLSVVREKNFSIIVIADPVSDDEVDSVKNGYERLGTHLSSLETAAATIQTGSNYTVSENTSESINEVLSKGISLTQGSSASSMYKREKSRDEERLEKAGNLLKTGAGLTALALTEGNIGAAYLAMNVAQQFLPTGSHKNTSLAVKKEPAEQGENRLLPLENYGSEEPDSITTADSEQKTVNTQMQEGHTTQVGTGRSETQTHSVSTQNTTTDLHIAGLNEKLKEYLNWLSRCRNYGMFNCCTYIISGSASVNLFVAGQYQSLIQSYGESRQPVSINTWTKENGIEKVRQSLLHLVHPTFEYSKEDDSVFTTAMLLSSKELSRQMAFPQKSILGVSVAKHAAFGIEVVRKSPIAKGSLIRIGEVSYMGKNTKQPVLLDLESLSAHTFIAGTNGSGKSNAVFRIIEELMRQEIPFMVIEPAKGEYKNLFGNEPNVAVYGTNPKKTRILRINPFWFNEDVTVHEHIEKLVEIFNASWSMYAAMSSVLKSSIQNAYKSCGWNIKTSECLGNRRFPTVKDVLNEFHKKMEDTEFSGEVKGNYVGALSTRMESLCTGIYEEIFMGEDIGDEKLFDSNVLIDLSRVGSAETKSMIMGILIIRLQEYRMKQEAMNVPLQHVTILEEAHHLLRRTSMAQSEEGSNMLGKSVEMISNQIAEMRSYGEGFMIVDQSPGLLDMSVIRNTNTKIILRLPEGTDREIVGNTIGLTQEQIQELSKLKTGVCAIYQKDWLESVLCMVDKAFHEAKIYQYVPDAATDLKNEKIKEARGTAFRVLTPLVKKEGEDFKNLTETAALLEGSDEDDKKLAHLLKQFIHTGKVREKGILEPYATIVWNLLDGEYIWEYIYTLIQCKEIEQMDELLRQQICKKIVCDKDTQTALISLFLQKKGANEYVRHGYAKWAAKFICFKEQ